MTLTVLLDLDDTLLTNDMDRFLPAYLKLLGKHIKDLFPEDQFISTLLASTRSMVENRQPNLTLEEAFDNSFYPALGIKKDILEPRLLDFYENIFPSLRNLTSPKPFVRELVDHILSEKNKIVIATNPLFPLRAIQLRIEWAGLADYMDRFEFVTSFETFHFSKPHIEYYAEIISRFCWSEAPVVMIGNSLEDDILPAAQLGIPVYLVSEKPASLPENFPKLSKTGKITDIPDWLKQVQSQYSSPPSPNRLGLVAALQATPAAFDHILRTTNSKQWQISPPDAGWNLTEILCHLRDVDLEVNYPRLIKILNEPSTFLAGVLSDQWAIERNYKQQNTQSVFLEFITARTKLVSLIQRLTSDQWQLPAQHAIFGPTTIQELVSFMYIHDRSHILQGYQAVLFKMN